MKPQPPTTQRRFATPWGELDYVCTKIRYWFYTRKQKNRAGRYVDRLERILRDLPENDIAIIREEVLALLYELEGQIAEAIAHRRREVQLMERLHREAQSTKYTDPTRAYMLRGRETADLLERRAILESLRKAKPQLRDAMTKK